MPVLTTAGMLQPICCVQGDRPPSGFTVGSPEQAVGVPTQAAEPPVYHEQPSWPPQVVAVVSAAQVGIVPVHAPVLHVQSYSPEHAVDVRFTGARRRPRCRPRGQEQARLL